MENAITWVLIGIFALFIVIGFLIGVIRGLKRSAIHIAFVVVSIILAFLLTKTITNLILGIKIPIAGTSQTISDYILSFVEKNFDITEFRTATDFVTTIPMVVASPFVFLVLQILIGILFDIIYMIVVRVSFGKKKEDFKNHKPLRAYGGVVGLVEGLFLLVLVFAPLTSLTKTANSILYDSSSNVTAENIIILDENNSLRTVGEIANEKLPKEIKTYLNIYNNSVIGKVSGVVGVDNLMFDYLTSFNINGEKIVFRKDVVEVINAYDNFVLVYNAFNNNNFQISVKDFVSSVKNIIKSGIFKTVVSDTIRDVVVNYDDVMEKINIDIPEIAEDVIKNLKDKFSANNFNAYDYLAHDINLILDTFQNVVEENVVKNIVDMSEISLSSILNFVYDNTTLLKTNTQNLLNMNLVNDNFGIIIDGVSEKFVEQIENPNNLEIDFNEDISNKNAMVDKIYKIANDLKSINDDLSESDLSLSSLLEGDTFMKLSEINDVESVLLKLGNILDTAREFDLLIIPQTEEHPNKTYVMDNILKCYNLDLLGDSENYTAFFEELSTPIQNAKDLGLVDVVNGEEVDIVKVLDKVKENPDILKDTIVPFYNFRNTKIGEKTLKEMVFDEVLTSLTADIDMLDFSEYQLPENDTKENWEMAFEGLGEALKQLHSTNVEGTEKSYAQYLVDGGKVEELSMQEIGKIINIVKVNAFNDGNENLKGVLNDKFMETIYIMTGDVIDDTKDYSSLTKIDNYNDIKNYIEATGDEYYQVDFEEKLIEVDNAITLGDKMKTETQGLDVKTQPQAVVNAIKDATDAMEMTDEEIVETIENLNKLVSSNSDRKIFDVDSLEDGEKAEARNKIIEKYEGHTDVANALITLLGL